MRAKKSIFSFHENMINLIHKKTEIEIFESIHKMCLIEQRYIVPDKLNAVGVSAEFFTNFGDEKMLLVNADNNKYINVCLKRIDELEGNDLLVATYSKNLLNLQDSENIFLCKYKDLIFNNILTQKIDHIRECDLVISERDCESTLCSIENSPCEFFELYNTFSHESLVVKRSHIFVDKSLNPGEIRLSRKQRIVLGLEIPQYLSQKHWDILCKKLDKNSEDFKLISELYSTDDRILKKDISYKQKLFIKRVMKQYCSGNIQLIPVPNSTKKIRKGILHRLCDFYVGKSTISLVCRRPYEIDEGLDIIRITKSNMNLLGIDEMDKVTLQYKNEKISCRVLELDDEEAFFNTNLPISLDLVVAIPVHIRKKLNITDLSTSIKIDRDTAFIFKKSLNEQVVPILLTIFSTNLFADSSVIFSMLLLIFMIPLVLYLNLSNKRNMRA